MKLALIIYAVYFLAVLTACELTISYVPPAAVDFVLKPVPTTIGTVQIQVGSATKPTTQGAK